MKPRYKVWTIDPDGQPGTLLLRTGSIERGDHDVDYAGDTPGQVAKAALRRIGEISGRVIVKNFDTEAWHVIDVSGDVTTYETHVNKDEGGS